MRSGKGAGRNRHFIVIIMFQTKKRKINFKKNDISTCDGLLCRPFDQCHVQQKHAFER